MFKMVGVFICLLVCCWGEIKECTSLHPLLDEKEAVFVFDLDNTLIRPVQPLGSDEWFCAYYSRALANAVDKEDCRHRCVALWRALHTLTPVQTVEKDTSQIIRHLQEKAPVIALTRRGTDSLDITQWEVRSVDLDFTRNPLSRNNFALCKMSPAEYCNGIIFTDNQHKGEVLLNFLEQIAHKPKRIIFVDDSLKHVESVSIVEKEGIEYVGIRYSGADHFVQTFDAEKCDKKLERLLQILQAEE